MIMVKKEIYNQLLQCPEVPPEIGGILGGRDGIGIIDAVIFDRGTVDNSRGIYTPNISLLNKYINQWHEEGITFYGIFHTHAQQWKSLSGEDKKYIERIMKAMPDEVEFLLFPLVFPKYEVKLFKAVKNKSKVDIINENIKIISRENRKNGD